jgi:antitoxin component YwqK of YwqJK toxin-antitoxin module
MAETVPTVVAPCQAKRELKTLVELCAVVVAWNYNESTTALPCEVVECLQKHMKSWRQKKYFHEYKEWYPSGQVAWYERYNDEGAKEGECKQWYEDGHPKLLCHYKAGLLDGEWKQWYEDGVLWNHRFYKDGELHGEAKSWNEKGVLKSHGNYKDGKRHGEYRAWRKNSQLMSHSYFKDGERHGMCRHWWGNGRLYLLMNFKKGVKHGECREWRKDGQIKVDEFYVEGKKQPPWQRSFLGCCFFGSPQPMVTA